MQFYHFSEQPYPDAWELGLDSLRNTIPNSLCNPEVANRIYHERLDEYRLCDDLGINIMVNEHHVSATCISPSPTLHLAILARETKNVRLLALGIPLANRLDPLRVAEELAMIDVISGGRLEVGFVKGAPYELSPANSNPGRYMERFWESHDLIAKLLATRDGPFNWEGEFFHYRQANIWPQPWQQPHPPIWITAGSPESTKEIAKRDRRLAVFLAGRQVKRLFDLYRQTVLEEGRPEPAPDRFAYLAMLAVGNTREEAERRAHDIHGYMRTTMKVGEAFMNPPGYMSAKGNASWLQKNQVRGRAGNHFPATTRDGRVINQAQAPLADLVSADVLFCGTPNEVYEQISDFCDHVGGIGHLLLMMHGGPMSHAEAKANITLFARQVMPRLKKRYDYDNGRQSAAATA